MSIRKKNNDTTLFVKLIILITMGLLSHQTFAQEPDIQKNTLKNSQAKQLAKLEVTPERCVSLHRGQTCYLNVIFVWQHAEQADYCLVNQTTNKLLKCWSQAEKGEHRLDFQSPKSNTFVLRQKSSLVDLVATKIEVAWVYNSSKRAKSSWRLF